MKNLLIAAVFLLQAFSLWAQTPEKVRVFYLGGQSNMDGYGYVKDLPGDLKKPIKDVYIFHGNTLPDDTIVSGEGIWAPLQAGHGVGFGSDGKKNNYSDRFGVELSFARKLREKYPNEKIAIIKYSRGGTSIDSLANEFGNWDPRYRSGNNQYDHFLATIRNAFANTDIDGDGKEEELIPSGIVWMQGESDANIEATAKVYYDNLNMLMSLVRAALRNDKIPVVIGKISDSWYDKKDGKQWDYGELVQYAQEKFARTDRNAAIVRTTRYYKYSDPWHYDSPGFIDLGEKFAETMINLQDK